MRHLIVYEKDPRWLLWPKVQESLEQFRKAGLVFEAITNTPEQMDTVLDTARRMPDLAIVLNHLGRPPLPEKGWEPWASQIAEAAKFPNVSVKLSVGGDIVWRWPWSIGEIRRYSDQCLQHFGARRVMAGSNWPVVLLSGGFQQVWRGIEDLLSGLRAAERADVLGGAAERIYRLNSAQSCSLANGARPSDRSGFVFERQRDAGAERRDLAVLHRHVHLRDLGDAQVAQRRGGGFDRAPAGVLPGRLADADHIDDPVNASLLFFAISTSRVMKAHLKMARPGILPRRERAQ